MSTKGTVKRGSVIWLNLYPHTGHEQTGWCPAIVLSDGFIDPSLSKMALIVPVTNQQKGNTFEVPVPSGISTTGAQITFSELSGVVLTDHVKSVDLSARNAEVIGEIDPKSEFYQTVVDYVRAILADAEDDE
ncbi:type II toxin-antitoxin system PemK/MazF family toxin [Paenibacillus jiagnxiensis]|uniref:type II toxin-antitoxin system PemK/MazF family toxin n=1 Tax=Paenibacillus jiagnxiensis TaxID=3228926 RepID=UPI0033A612EF